MQTQQSPRALVFVVDNTSSRGAGQASNTTLGMLTFTSSRFTCVNVVEKKLARCKTCICNSTDTSRTTRNFRMILANLTSNYKLNAKILADSPCSSNNTVRTILCAMASKIITWRPAAVSVCGFFTRRLRTPWYASSNLDMYNSISGHSPDGEVANSSSVRRAKMPPFPPNKSSPVHQVRRKAFRGAKLARKKVASWPLCP